MRPDTAALRERTKLFRAAIAPLWKAGISIANIARALSKQFQCEVRPNQVSGLVNRMKRDGLIEGRPAPDGVARSPPPGSAAAVYVARQRAAAPQPPVRLPAPILLPFALPQIVRRCQFPIGCPGKPTFRFCDVPLSREDIARGRSYCPECHKGTVVRVASG